MYKILIVEDEEGIRKSLIKCVDWESLNCIVCGEAATGLEALEKYLEIKPDIILTDIVMPGIDGITFLKYIKSKDKDVKIILLSGHSEFEYAQEAVNYGASHFFLKPVNFNELIGALKSLVLEISQQKRTSDKKHSQTEKLRQRQEFLIELISGKTLTDKYIDERILNFELDFKKYFFALLEFDDSDDVSGAVKDRATIKDLYAMVGSYTEKRRGLISFIVDKRSIGLLLPAAEGEDTGLADVSDYMKNMQSKIKDAFRQDFSIGISLMGNDVKRMNRYFIQAKSALDYRFYYGPNYAGVYKLDTFNIDHGDETASVAYDHEIEKAVRVSDKETLVKCINEIFDHIVVSVYYEQTIIKSVVVSTLMQSIKKVYGGGKLTEKMLSEYHYFDRIIKANYLDTIRHVFVSVLIELNDFTLKRKNTSKSDLIKMIIEYIERHYQENITLQDIGELVYFTPAYVSSLISSELGKSFVEVLNEVRIKNAKRLLAETNMKKYEVAGRVGIPDPQYFSQVFRKVTGQTPTEYCRSLR